MTHRDMQYVSGKRRMIAAKWFSRDPLVRKRPTELTRPMSVRHEMFIARTGRWSSTK